MGHTSLRSRALRKLCQLQSKKRTAVEGHFPPSLSCVMLLFQLKCHTCAFPMNSEGFWMEAPVTHTKIRDIYFMAVITVLQKKECDLGGDGSWAGPVWICLWLSAVIPFQRQCVECKLLKSYRQTGCGCLESTTR